MVARWTGSFATLLVCVPLLIVPVLAVVGVPEFGRVSASSPAGSRAPDRTVPAQRGWGQSDCHVSGDRWAGFGEIESGAGRSGRAGIDLAARPDEYSAAARSTRPAVSKPASRSNDSPTRAELLRDPSRMQDDRAEPLPTDLTRASVRVEGPLGAPRSPFARSAVAGQSDGRVRTVAFDDLAGDADPLGFADPDADGLASRPSITWPAAVRRLKELGIRDYRLLPSESSDDFHFCCFYAPTGDPRITRRFEAEASDPLRAVEMVLAQVEASRPER